jgi:hypothetical protein
MHGFEFDRINYSFDAYGYIRLLFVNETDSQAIEFDGFSFHLLKGLPSLEGMEVMTYLPLVRNGKSKIVGIRQLDLDIHYVEMGNGDIFQIYHMADDAENQRVAIFDQGQKDIAISLGISSYDAARKRMNEGEEVNFE